VWTNAASAVVSTIRGSIREQGWRNNKKEFYWGCAVPVFKCIMFTPQHQNSLLKRGALNLWCCNYMQGVIYRRPDFSLLSEWGVPENHHVYWKCVKYGNGGFMPEHAGLQFSVIKHSYTYCWDIQRKRRTIMPNTKQSQERIKMVCKFTS
jgi:hypothetical protein